MSQLINYGGNLLGRVLGLLTFISGTLERAALPLLSNRNSRWSIELATAVANGKSLWRISNVDMTPMSLSTRLTFGVLFPCRLLASFGGLTSATEVLDLCSKSL